MLTLIAVLAALVLGVHLIKRHDKAAAALRAATVDELEASSVEDVAAWPEGRRTVAAELVKKQRVLLGIGHGDLSQPAMVTDRIDRELERVAAAEQKLVDADRMATGIV